ncbi:MULTISPECIES: hypothetical protein [Bradyrhizobium]|jgi:hypothetical protein|uniref:hypothetical protein n=1 Tax=Bradyrhizobium TaxID=374 RepID=UPI0004BBB67B|nr:MULTISPECIES: hypothetical protein [Bradyrhizobium]MCS3444976.1 hypothetical protein [Bradyrhizobium elkanii]MCS3563896.1 hypothetical protein [Bradyrhizobium elkanii]MCW2146272.1 hypothetical protein [Bradyrhizobium elkanii]MCW2354655.1 hypothetical protein [Bradyrhizobium elkanii]MCW2379099.1 hypothetical protein [Bradyrhizobium elkanii]
MLRLKILTSVVPLAVAAVLARAEFLPGPRPCIEVGGATMQIASIPWLAQLHVSFTDDPSQATVRVQIADSADGADFTVIDDIDDAEAGACERSAAARLIGISSDASATGPVIYLTHDAGPSDYRVFVQSKTFSVRDAAALIVSARGGHRRLEAASPAPDARVPNRVMAELTPR